MSIPVELDALESKTAEYGWAYVLTVTDSSTPKIVATTPTWSDGAMLLHEGGGSARNADARSTITVAYPPVEPDGYTLIVDGEAAVDRSDDDHTVIRLQPSGAVLHRAAAPGFGGSATGCSHDCAPVE
ncbi:MAG: pyridoxamine 5'-phosphate oxidase family protein [Actinomycetota bacterium]